MRVCHNPTPPPFPQSSTPNMVLNLGNTMTWEVGRCKKCQFLRLPAPHGSLVVLGWIFWVRVWGLGFWGFWDISKLHKKKTTECRTVMAMYLMRHARCNPSRRLRARESGFPRYFRSQAASTTPAHTSDLEANGKTPQLW